jgi:hypothetical protein
MNVIPQLFTALEQIMSGDNSNWRTLACDPSTGAIGDRRIHIETPRREK